MNNFLKLLYLIVLFIVLNYNCLQIIPERAHVTYYNDKYIGEASINVRRSARRGDYVINACANLKYSAGNNVSVDYIFYEYIHNGYRRSFQEFHYKLCDLVLKDEYLGAIARSRGLVTCPIKADKYCLTNITFNSEIPVVWPFEKGKLETIFKQVFSGEVILTTEVIMSFKRTSKLPKMNH